MSNLLKFEETKLDILTRNGMTHMVGINPDGFIPISGVLTTHLDSPFETIDALTLVLQDGLEGEEADQKLEVEKYGYSVSPLLEDGTQYEFKTVKDITRLTSVNINTAMKDFVKTFVESNNMGTIENAREVMKDKLFLLKISSEYKNKDTGLVNNYTLLPNYIDLATNTLGEISKLDYTRSNISNTEGKTNPKPTVSNIGRIAKEAVDSFDFLNDAGKLKDERKQELQDRVFEYADYLTITEFNDFEVTDEDIVARTPDEELSYNYAKMFFKYLTTRTIKDTFLSLTYVKKRGSLIPIGEGLESEGSDY